MLTQLLHEIETSDGPLTLGDLQRKLGVEASALQGMIDYLVQTGRLVEGEATTHSKGTAPGQCGPSCTDQSTCYFVAKMPNTYSLQVKK